MKTLIRPSFTILALMIFVTGLVYPLAITALAQILFPHQADGSIIAHLGRPVGSKLIGQNFSDPKYFWGRLSATAPFPYNGQASGGSNFGPLNPALADAARARVDALWAQDPSRREPVPADLVSASASGLDPHISAAAAEYQLGRIAAARGLPPERLLALIRAHTETPFLGVIGAPRVNVLELNLALDDLAGS